MIVEPDFLDHWKTQLLVQLTGEPTAPLLMIRIWGHCHTRKAWRFLGLSDHALAAICRWKGEPATLRSALVESGYVTEETDSAGTWTIAHDFEEVNRYLVANWTNGGKGGRPPKTHPKPADNPSGTHREPIDGSYRSNGSNGLDGSSHTPKPPAGRNGKKKAPKAGCAPSSHPNPLIRDRMIAINALFRRLDSTVWTADELEAFTAAGLDALSPEAFAEQLAPLTGFYGADIPREKDYRRRDVLRLLRNWGGEIDRARLWARDHTSQGDLRHL